MPGFPTRPSRLAFGPLVYSNRFAPQEPNKEVDAKIFNLDYWQVAGCGVMSWRTFAAISVDGAGAVSLSASAEAWDSEAAVVPALSKEAVGHYRLTYDATYPDEVGAAIATALIDAWSRVRLTAAAAVFYESRCQVLASGREIDVFVQPVGGGALVDPVSQVVSVRGY